MKIRRKAMIKIYTDVQCPKPLKVLDECKNRKIDTDYRSISENLKDLSAFTLICYNKELFSLVKKSKRLGIPCIICENGEIFDSAAELFDLEAVMARIRNNLLKPLA